MAIATPQGVPALATHPCAHHSCEREIDRESFACLDHWSQLSARFRLSVRATWGDEDMANLLIEAAEFWGTDGADEEEE